MSIAQRKIKFRAWDKKRKRMYEVLHLHTETIVNGGVWADVKGYDCIEDKDIVLQIQPDHIEVMQFTGLHDKNGKEIYEGDIVEITGPYTIHSAKHFQYSREMYSNGERFVVIWNDAGYEVRCLRDWVVNKKKNFTPNGYNYKPYVDFYDFWNLQRNFTVIGNTYDNPELLEDFHD